jgi:hypothetical protein
MAWKAYKLSYRALSPVHIGWHTLGYIKLTRHYITGKAMWGAMTANLTRALGSTGTSGYEKFGKLLKENIMVSYFYPAIDHEKPLLPKFTSGGLNYGDHTSGQFERLFIKSYGQTAVLPDTNTAEDETLHESEFISPVVYEDEKQKAVYFVGYIFISDKAGYNWGQIKGAVSEIFVGGDRKYGWGRLLLDDEKTREVKDSMVFGNTLVSDDKGLKIEIEKENSIPAHLGVNNELNLKGYIEPLVGMDFENNKGFGQNVSKAEICWVPGSIAANGMTLRIGAYGMLEKGYNHG